MKAKFFVIDGEGNPSYSAEKERPESFASLKAAKKRAIELAENEPGTEVHIARTLMISCCSVLSAATTRVPQ